MADSPTTYIGIEIGGTKLQLVAGDGHGRIVRRWRAGVDRSKGGPGICRQIREGLADLTGGVPCAGVGVGFGGPIDVRTGRVRRSHQIEGWEDFPLRDWLAEQAGGAPVGVDNDANTAALGESTLGAGSGLGAAADPLFYVTLGSGVGGGLVAGGRIYHGAPPGEAEFGHLRLDRDGTTVESRCSGWSVDARLRRLAAETPDGQFARLLGNTPGGEARHLSAALAADDAAARQVLRDVAEDLAFALSHVTHLVHPRMIVLGGGLALVGEPLRAAVAGALPGFVMKAFVPGPEVRLAGLGEDAVPVGALQLAIQAGANRS